MKKLFTLSALAVLMFSCQKEISYEDPNNPGGGGNNDGTKLVRVGVKSGTDSITVNYTYNGNAKITEVNLSGKFDGDNVYQNSKYTRNSWNIITQETYKSSDLDALGLVQGVVFDHIYDDANSRYTYSKMSITGVGVVDSIVYQYGNSSRITGLVHWARVNGVYEEARKEEFTYSGTNVATIKYYEYDDQASQFVLDQTETYEYDTKTNPLLFTTDAVVLRNTLNLDAGSSLALYYSASNYTKLVSTGAWGDYTIAKDFTYNSNNRPATATVGGGALVYTYYYQ